MIPSLTHRPTPQSCHDHDHIHTQARDQSALATITFTYVQELVRSCHAEIMQSCDVSDSIRDDRKPVRSHPGQDREDGHQGHRHSHDIPRDRKQCRGSALVYLPKHRYFVLVSWVMVLRVAVVAAAVLVWLRELMLQLQVCMRAKTSYTCMNVYMSRMHARERNVCLKVELSSEMFFLPCHLWRNH